MSNRAAAALLMTLAGAAPLAAQVGYDPQHSPFRDVTTRQTFSTFVSAFFGNTGDAGVGAQSGRAIGGRFATALSGPLELWVTVAGIDSKRTVLDPNQPDSARVLGTQALRMIDADLGLGLNLTGARTWHGLAPYVGASFGVIAPTRSVTDTSGFQVTSHITFVPTIGTHYRIGRALSLTVEARDIWIKYSWPSAFFFPTAGTPVLPVTDKDTQLAHNFTLSAGLSYHFNI